MKAGTRRCERSRARLGRAVSGALWAVLFTHCGGSSPEPRAPATEIGPHAEQSPEGESTGAEALTADEEQSAPSRAEQSPLPKADEAPAAASPVPEAGGPELERSPAKDNRGGASSDADDLAGSGSSAQVSEIHRAFELQTEFEWRFTKAIAVDAPNCELAETFRRSVCDLAERICALESKLPSSTRERYCGDSRARCSHASANYRQACQP
jgi:hypothetical protein